MSKYAREFNVQRHMPEQVIVQILVRLPLKSVGRFKCVSKAWHALINSPYFKQHYNLLNTNKIRMFHFPRRVNKVPIFSRQASLLGPGDDSMFGIEDAPFLHAPHQLGLHGSLITIGYNASMDRTVKDKEFRSAIWGPINGVYCIKIKARISGRSTLLLWSPGAKQFHVLPPIPTPVFPPTIARFLEHNEFREHYTLCGYGYDLSTNDYKIILTNVYGDRYDDMYHHYCFNLYSLATNEWQQLDPFQIVKDKSMLEVYHSGGIAFNYDINLSFFDRWDDGVYSNGACHWLITSSSLNEGYSILSFNFGDVVFQVTPIPLTISEGKKFSPTLKIIKGCLALVFPLDFDWMKRTSNAFEVYVMREYGVEDSWIAAYKIELKSPGTLAGIINDDFYVGEADEGNGKVVSYRLSAAEPGQERSVCCYLDDNWIEVLPYEESCVSVVPPKS